jgi:endonuclease-3
MSPEPARKPSTSKPRAAKSARKSTGTAGRPAKLPGGSTYKPRTPPPARRERAMRVYELLGAAYPQAHIALGYEDAFQLLVAVILSAQTTDVGVNKVTPILFAAYPDAESLAAADTADVERIVHPTGFFRNKTKNIQGAARAIVAEHGGCVPDTMAELITLPGVARKTANIVLANAYGVIDGIAVDTHVLRLSARLGFTKNDDPVKVEADLMALFPCDVWMGLTYRIIEHGRAVCSGQRPICGGCVVSDLCPSAFKIEGWREPK